MLGTLCVFNSPICLLNLVSDLIVIFDSAVPIIDIEPDKDNEMKINDDCDCARECLQIQSRAAGLPGVLLTDQLLPN